MTPPPNRTLAYAAWIAVCLIWGTTYLAIKICLETIPPTLMGGLRFTLAGSILLGLLRAMGHRLPARVSWRGVALVGMLMVGLGNGGVVWSEVWVSSGLTAVLIASTPFWMVGIEALLPSGDRLRPAHVLGLLLGFGGIVLLVRGDLAAGEAQGWQVLAGTIAVQIACAGWALGSFYSRRHARHENALTIAALQMLSGGASLTIAGTVLGEWERLHFTAQTFSGFLYLVLVGGIGGFASYTYALKHLPVATVSLYAYMNPVIAVALGWLILGERVDGGMAIAVVIILVGVAIVQSASRRTASGRERVSEAA